jgi:hypothetical protein
MASQIHGSQNAIMPEKSQYDSNLELTASSALL